MTRASTFLTAEQKAWINANVPKPCDPKTAPPLTAEQIEVPHYELPPEVLISTLQDHQRYFPVRGSDGKLLTLADGSIYRVSRSSAARWRTTTI